VFVKKKFPEQLGLHCYAVSRLHIGMTLSLAPHKKTLDPPMVNHFRNKIVSASAQRNVHIIQILYRVPPKTGLFRGDFLFVRRKCHARVTSGFFSDQVVVLEDSSHITYWRSFWPNRFCT